MLNRTQWLKITLVGTAVLTVVLVLAWWPGAMAATYEIHPDITVDSRSLPMAMVDAYERLADQYLILVQDSLIDMRDRMEWMQHSLDDITARLDDVTRRLDDITHRLDRTENRPAGVVRPSRQRPATPRAGDAETTP